MIPREPPWPTSDRDKGVAEWLGRYVCVCIYRKVNVYVCICIHTHFSIYISKYTCKWIYFPMKVILVLSIKMRMSVGVRKGLRGIKSEKVNIIVYNYG